MGCLYLLINEKTKKTFVGKTNYPKWLLKLLLYDTLDNKKHYNDLLQQDWLKYNFKLIFWDTDNISQDCDNLIKNKNLLNPIYGYNMFIDLQNKKGRHKKNEVYSDDICLTYAFFPKIQFVARSLNMERNTVSNRLSNHEMYDDDYYKKKIATYDDYYWTSMRLIFTNKNHLIASQILDKMMNRYDVSGMLRITPRKISRFYKANGILAKDDTKRGCLAFYPQGRPKEE